MNPKLKYYNGKTNTDFHGKKIPKANFPWYYLTTIVVDYVCRIKNDDDKYYPNIYLEECEYEKQKRKKKHMVKNFLVMKLMMSLSYQSSSLIKSRNWIYLYHKT